MVAPPTLYPRASCPYMYLSMRAFGAILLLLIFTKMKFRKEHGITFKLNATHMIDQIIQEEPCWPGNFP